MFAVLVLLFASCAPAAPSPPVTTVLEAAPGGGSTSTTVMAKATTTVTAPPSTATPTAAEPEAATARPTVRVALVGDVMLGRGISRIVRNDPEGLFRDVRFVLSQSDIAAGNLESPLTHRPHIASNPFALEADPASAGSLALAGFDVLGLANNHAGDAGRASILDTIEAVTAAGMATVGGGADLAAASEPTILEADGLAVGFLAFDATGAGTAASDTAAGIVHWDDDMVQAAVGALRPQVDVLVVGVHGGVEYRTWTDPYMAALAERLHEWGADVVWGSGPHVAQPVYVIAGHRPTVVATSLGNFIFDQGDRLTKEGTILEVLADADGVVAFRVGATDHRDRRVHFDGWSAPPADAALLGSEWWQLARRVDPEPDGEWAGAFRWGDLVAASIGDVDGDGDAELAASFRRPYREHPIRALFPERPWADATGRTSHVGLFRPSDQEPEWIAAAVFRPVDRLVACDGSMAVGYAAGGVSGWRWNGFGFLLASPLAGQLQLGCFDVDGDGRLDPVFQEPEDDG